MWHRTNLSLSDFAHVLWRRTLVEINGFLGEVLSLELGFRSEAEMEHRRELTTVSLCRYASTFVESN
jgi:hypothetical protein